MYKLLLLLLFPLFAFADIFDVTGSGSDIDEALDQAKNSAVISFQKALTKKIKACQSVSLTADRDDYNIIEIARSNISISKSGISLSLKLSVKEDDKDLIFDLKKRCEEKVKIRKEHERTARLKREREVRIRKKHERAARLKRKREENMEKLLKPFSLGLSLYHDLGYEIALTYGNDLYIGIHYSVNKSYVFDDTNGEINTYFGEGQVESIGCEIGAFEKRTIRIAYGMEHILNYTYTGDQLLTEPTSSFYIRMAIKRDALEVGFIEKLYDATYIDSNLHSIALLLYLRYNIGT